MWLSSIAVVESTTTMMASVAGWRWHSEHVTGYARDVICDTFINTPLCVMRNKGKT